MPLPGPEEELPRPMDCFEFVCHAPSEYFRSKSAPYPTPPTKPEVAYIWTSVGHEIRPVPTQAEIFGLAGVDRMVVGKGGKVGGKGRGGRKVARTEKVEKPLPPPPPPPPMKMPEIKVEIKEEVI